MATNHKFGTTSLRRLDDCHSILRMICTTALQLSEDDFSIIETLRSAETQAKYFKEGFSKLDGVKRRSWHQIQPDGTAHAVDVCIWRDGKLQWDEGAKLIPVFAKAAEKVYHNCGRRYNVRSGYGWQFLLREGKALTEEEIEEGLQKYFVRKKAQGKKPFVDSPHLELLLE